MKNAFYFTFTLPSPIPNKEKKLCLIFIPIKLSEIYRAGRVKSSLNFCLKFLVISKRLLDQRDVKFKIYDVTTWLTNNYKTHYPISYEEKATRQ